jgi:signal transduction histidine kinase
MMRDDAELLSCVAFAIAEEVLSKARHDLRNRLGAIQNAAFYIERKTRPTALWNEPRIAPFFAIIADEVGRAQAILNNDATVVGQATRKVAPSKLSPCLERALRSASIPDGVSIETTLADTAAIEIEPTDVAVLAMCLIEEVALAVPPPGAVHVRSFDAEDRVALEVWSGDAGQPDEASPELGLPERSGMKLAIARRAATRAGAELTFRSSSAGALVRVYFPIPRPHEEADRARDV